MRFYSEIRIEPLKNLVEIFNNPLLVFSRDFIHYLAVLHDVAWCPIESKPGPYRPHPSSPCIKDMKKAMQLILAESALDYKLIYDELVPMEAENKLELFIDRAKSILSTLNNNPILVFLTFLHLGRWTVTFYTNGTKDAMFLAPYLMADALKKILENSSLTVWFLLFDGIPRDLPGLLRNEYDSVMTEESYRFYEELGENNDDDDDDDFEDCTLCSCGDCENHFEDSGDSEEESGEYSPDTYQGDYDLSGEYENSDMELEEFSEDTEDEENQGAA